MTIELKKLYASFNGKVSLNLLLNKMQYETKKILRMLDKNIMNTALKVKGNIQVIFLGKYCLGII